jgi:predicted Zn finger-like uncharacterized protein
MAGGRPPSLNSFTCPNCQALYHIVKVERGPETVDRDVTCRSCGAPLPGREGNFVLKYFMLRKAGRVQRWRRAGRRFLRLTSQPFHDQSSSSSRRTAGAFGFLTLSQCADRPAR